MTAVRDLELPYRLFASGAGHWRLTELRSAEPLTADGIRAFVRYEDVLGTRFGYIASRWGATQTPHGLLAEVLVYVVDGDAPGQAPRGHPGSDRRFHGIAEVDVATSPPPDDALAPPSPLLWARPEGGGPLVPVSVHDSHHGCAYVTVQGVGALPVGQLLARPGLAADVSAAGAPVPADLYRYEHRTIRRDIHRAAKGRVRPAARAVIGTLEQLGAGGTARA